MSEVKPIQSAPEGVKIETRIRDIHGVRNKQRLVRKGQLWYLPDMSMYVYYTPTEWRPLEGCGLPRCRLGAVSELRTAIDQQLAKGWEG